MSDLCQTARERRRSWARSYWACRLIQNSALLYPMRSRASAIAGEMPQRPLMRRDIVFRLTPRRAAHSVTVQPMASMLSRTLNPGCDGSVRLMVLPQW